MVDVVQLVEHRIVVPSVVGSSPIIHPTKNEVRKLSLPDFIFPLLPRPFPADRQSISKMTDNLKINTYIYNRKLQPRNNKPWI